MKKLSRLIAIVAMMTIIIASLGVTAYAATSGTTGSVSWSISSTTLTISGTGAMADYANETGAPWNSYKATIKTIVIADTVTSVSQYGFYGFTALTSVTIGSKVTKIGGYAFSGCTSLTSVTIPESVISIGNSAFYGCSKLATVNYNAKRCPTAGSASYPIFNKCTALKTVNIGSGVQMIPEYFFEMSSISSVTIPDNVKSIGQYAFYGCTSLTSVNLGNKICEIPERAFRGCTALKQVQFSELLTSIGSEAFANCSSLSQEMNLSQFVTHIGPDAFDGTPVKIITYTDAYAYKYCGAYNISCLATQASYGDVTPGGGGGGGDVTLSVNIVDPDLSTLNGKMVIDLGFDKTLTSECVHIAFYNASNHVVDYMILPIKRATDSVYVVTYDVTSAVYAKAFVWDSLENCRPISPVKTIVINRP